MTARELLDQAADPDIDRVYAFWSAARGTHAYPSQRDLDLPSIPKLLPKFFILDRVGATFRYRFMGSAIDQHVGMSLTGKLFTDVRTGQLLDVITKFFADTLDNGQMGLLTTRMPSEKHEWLTYRRIALPVADDHVSPNKVVGLFLMEKEDRSAPKRRSVLEGENAADGTVVSQYANLSD